jgi:hypothetical protein
MQKDVGWLWIAGFFISLAATNAQTPSPPTANTQFDGKYTFVSSTNLSETFMTRETNRIYRCRDLRGRGPLTIANGHARYNDQEGTVGPHGDLLMRIAPTPRNRGESPGTEGVTSGWIDGNGTVRACFVSYYCNRDLIWKKEAR